MTDTPPEVERLYRQMLMARSDAERLRMGFEMLQFARALATAGLPEEHPVAVREQLFLRFYATDFSPQERARVQAAIRSGITAPSREP